MPHQPSLHVNKRFLFRLLSSIFALSATAPAAMALYPVATYSTASSFRDIEVVGPRAYVADGSAGLVIFDVSDPRQPIALGGSIRPASH